MYKLNLAEHPDRANSLWGLVPVKDAAKAKQRLKPCLDTDRSGFSCAMFMDVMRAMKYSREINNIAIVTSDPWVVGIAESQQLLVVDEIESMGLNPALELGIEAIRRRGGRRIVIMPADIPLVTGAEIDSVLHSLSIQRQAGDNALIGITPAKNGDGTNLLCLDTNHLIPMSYGADSYNLHLAIAAENRLSPVTLHSATISRDIDEQRDLEELIAYCLVNPQFQKTATWHFLHQNGYIKQAGRRRTG